MHPETFCEQSQVIHSTYKRKFCKVKSSEICNQYLSKLQRVLLGRFANFCRHSRAERSLSFKIRISWISQDFLIEKSFYNSYALYPNKRKENLQNWVSNCWFCCSAVLDFCFINIFFIQGIQAEWRNEGEFNFFLAEKCCHFPLEWFSIVFSLVFTLVLGPPLGFVFDSSIS